MYVIRQAHASDLDLFFKLAKTVHFINLPADKDIIAEKIDRSTRSFQAVHDDAAVIVPHPDNSAVGASPLFMFTIEDPRSGNALGTSMIVARMGGPGHPNLSFELQKRHFFSEDLQQGTSHTLATLVLDESGPTEIGGLILGPTYRGHPDKLGKQISLIRFHYLGLHRKHFADRVLAEMMAPITPEGGNTLWEYLGRRFINLPYTEADKFCQRSREFMTSLLPREPIYLSLLPPEARKLVGQVGPDTVPARKMLEDLGFRYTNRIDPFDGGPHLEALTDHIPFVKNTIRLRLESAIDPDAAEEHGFVSVDPADDEFRSAYSAFKSDRAAGTIRLPAQTIKALRADIGDAIGMTPLDLKLRPATKPSAAHPVGA
jgi:arginine N-succinyltransferase